MGHTASSVQSSPSSSAATKANHESFSRIPDRTFSLYSWCCQQTECRSYPEFVISKISASGSPFVPARIFSTTMPVRCSWSSSIRAMWTRFWSSERASELTGRMYDEVARTAMLWASMLVRARSAGEASIILTASLNRYCAWSRVTPAV